MPAKDLFLSLYAYHTWANQRILDCAEKVSPEQWNTTVPISHGSLRVTLFHMMRTEWVWRTLMQEHRLSGPPPRPDSYSSLEDLKIRWQDEMQASQAFLKGLDEAELSRPVTITDRSGSESSLVLWDMLLHVLIHSIQHRSEAAAMLTNFDQSPGDIDYIFFISPEP
jgi:uncharacterized damage-inducible protein DinB